MLKFIGVYDYTVILTYCSLFSALLGMVAAGKGRFTAAIICLCLCGFFDAFDGAVARTKKNRTDDEKAFGIQLDSLADVISFGAFPAYLSYCMGMNSILGVAILLLYSMCAVSRLAFFNVEEAKRQKAVGGVGKVYRGLPVTSISMTYPVLFLFRRILPAEIFLVLIHVLMALTGFLFVLDFSVKKINFDKLIHR